MSCGKHYCNLPHLPQFERWCEATLDLDKGFDVVENVKNDIQLEVNVYFDFTRSFAVTYDSQSAGSSKPDLAKKIYEETSQCVGYYFQGKNSSVNVGTTLHRLMNEATLKGCIAEAMGKLREDAEEAWQLFQDLSDDEKLEIMSMFTLGSVTTINWAYFDSEKGEHGSLGDPLEGVNAEECCTALGLPSEWRSYDYGQPIWRIHYNIEASVERKIPTVADSGGWNPYWQCVETDRNNTRWGLTRPLGSSREEMDNRLPEIVHRGWRGEIRLNNIKLPEFLGER